MNGVQLTTWQALKAGIVSTTKAMAKWLVTTPAGWATLAIGAVAGLVKGYDALIGRQEKLSRKKIEDLDEDISKLDNEISSLEELQSKLEDAKGSRYKLSQIQNELNDAIGETQGLLNGESRAWDAANTKLKGKIELKKQQQKQMQQDKVNESKLLYDNNAIEIDWHTDESGEKAREYANALGLMETYTDGKTDWESYLKFVKSEDYKNLTWKQKTALGDAMTFKTTYDTEWAEYLKEQAETALSIFDETISNYDGAGGQEFIKGLISDMAQDGASLSEISSVVTQVIENQDMKDAIDKYWESLVNPDIDSEEALKAVKKIFDDIVKKKPELKDFFDNFYNGIVAGGKAATNTSSDVNKMTVSIGDLEKASDGIKTLGSAFKELSDNGYLTTKTLGEIKTATGLTDDEWKSYETTLINAKRGSSEFNQTMSDLTYKILENQFATVGLENATEDQIAAILRENGIANADALAIEYLARAKAQAAIKGTDFSNVENLNIQQLIGEGIEAGITEKQMYNLILSHIQFNATNLDPTQKVEALKQIMIAAGMTASAVNSVFGATSVSTWQEKLDWMTTNNVTAVEDAQGRTGKTKDGKIYNYKDYIYNGVRYDTVDDVNVAIARDNIIKSTSLDGQYDFTSPKYTNPSSSSSGSDKNTPDYVDPTDAIINRINLRSKELEQQEESIQNAIEIAELENDYKKQISLTNDLIDKRREHLGELENANWWLHNEAEYQRSIHTFYNEDGTESDENLWFDSQGNATEYYNKLINKEGITTEEREAIENLFEILSKYKKAYSDNAKEITETNKQILQDEEKIWDLRREEFDARLEESEYYIQHSKDFGWENGDSEIEARKRVLDWIQSDYYKSLIKDDEEYYKILEENRLKYNETLEEQFSKANDFANTYLDSQKTLLQSHFDIENSIAEARHEINKELETSMSMYEYLDEETRQLLFNQEDYNKLSNELNEIEEKALKLQAEYEDELHNSTLETVESITSNYEMQYETLMKSYEIAKADLEIAKKKQKLNNVLNERNVRMFINGSWQWVANTEDVANAKAELADAEYAKRVEESGLAQQESINNLTKQQDELSVVINLFENGVIGLAEAVSRATGAIGSMPIALSSMYSNLRSTSPFSSGGKNKDTGMNYSLKQIASMSTSERSEAWHGANEESKYYLHEANKADLNASHSYDDATGEWKKHADGTRYTPGGLTLMGEEGFEAYISSNGHLIPINQPTLGNIPSGGVVFNTDQMKNLRTLWDMSSLNLNASANYINGQPQQIDQHHDNRIIINGMTVDSGSSDGQVLISALRRYIGNH